MAKCFVIMSFSKQLEPVYSTAISEAIRHKGYKCNRADFEIGADDVPDTIIKSIIESDIVIVDLSESKPNVYFELGIAYSVKKPTICISQTTQLPFDVRNYRIIKYNLDNLKALRLEIEEAIDNIESYKDNPVTRSGREYFDLRGKIEENLRVIIAERRRTQAYSEFSINKWADNTEVADKLIESIWRRLSFDRKDKILIAISGAGSIGKSTFSSVLKHCLVEKLSPDKSIEILPTDSYMMDRAERLAKNITGFDIRAHNLESFENDITSLMTGESVSVAPYDHSTGFHIEKKVIQSPDILILEGIHSFHPPIDRFINYSAFIYTNKSHVKELKFLADFMCRDYTASEAFEHSEREYLDYEEHVYPYYKQANSVIYVEGYWLYRLGRVRGKYIELNANQSKMGTL